MGMQGSLPHRATALAEGERAFTEIAAVLDSDPERLVHGEDGRDWTAKHVYSHFDRWQRWTIEALATSLAAGREVEPYASIEEMEAINAGWAEEADALTFEQARELCKESREAMKRAYMALTEDEWQRWGRLYSAEFDGSHYRGHLEYIAHATG
jgi:hypothetical protein